MRTSEAVDLFLKSRRDSMLSEDTILLYQWVLTKLEIEFPTNLPTTRRELQFLFNEHSNLAPASQMTIRNRLRVFWAWLQEEDLCESNPVAKMPIPRQRPTMPRVLSEKETQRLLMAATSERDRAVLVVLLDTGLRVGELASLTRNNARPDGLTVNGKVGERVVPISPGVYELLLRQGNERGFLIGRRRPLSRSGIQGIVRACMRRAGYSPPKIGPHTLRHTFGVQYMVNGGDVASLQRILGHTKIETTMLYVQMSNAMVAQQHLQFSPMRNMTFAAD